MPSGFAAGDLLIGVAFSSLAAAPTGRPAGSTLIRNVSDGTTFNMDVVRKAAAGGDVFTWTATSRKWATVVLAVLAGTFDATTPVAAGEENGINHSSAATATYTTPSVTLGVDDCLLLAAFGNRVASTWTAPAQTPAMVEAADTTATGTTPASCCLYHSALNAVPTGAISRQATASLASADACMWIGAVRPGTAQTPTPGRWARGYPPGQRYQRATQLAAHY